MITALKSFHSLFSIAIIVSLLSACSSSSEENLNSGRGGNANSKLSIDITDAVIDDASEVWIDFSAITLRPSDEDLESITISFKPPKRIDLLKLHGTNIAPLLDEMIVPAGQYDWIRLYLHNEDDDSLEATDATIVFNDGREYPLLIPSADSSGLKINTPFELDVNKHHQFTIDFDLRKSVVYSSDNYILRPTLRLVDNTEAAVITGTVDSTLLKASSGCSDDDLFSGNAIYLFEGHSITPDDIDDKKPEPISSAKVILNSEGKFEYTLAFIEAGDYTIALTCQSDLDDPDTNDSIDFKSDTDISVSAQQTLEFNF